MLNFLITAELDSCKFDWISVKEKMKEIIQLVLCMMVCSEKGRQWVNVKVEKKSTVNQAKGWHKQSE